MTPGQTTMDPEQALDESLIRRVLGRVLDRLDVQPSAERTNAIRIDLDESMAPEIHKADSLAARSVAWAAIDGIVAAGRAQLGYRLHKRHGAREERKPYLDLRWSDEVEDLIRLRLGRPRKGPSYAAQWKALVSLHGLSLPGPALARLEANPIGVTGRLIEDVFSRFVSIRSLADEPLLLREVASRTFWGLSKLLDGRGDVVAALLGVEECPFPEQPIVLNVHLAAEARSFLFVENHVAFERLKLRGDLHDMALICSSGFRGAATRLRRTDGCSVYYTRQTPRSAIDPFETLLFSETDVPTFFWGDLDHAGMAILVSLRSSFPSARGWQPGYAPMLDRLLRGDGHSPAESGKEGQRAISLTGCVFADEVLIPALKTTGRFLDQE